MYLYSTFTFSTSACIHEANNKRTDLILPIVSSKRLLKIYIAFAFWSSLNNANLSRIQGFGFDVNKYKVMNVTGNTVTLFYFEAYLVV